MPVRPRRTSRALTVAATLTACVAAAAIPAAPAFGDDDARSSGQTRTIEVKGVLVLEDAKSGKYRAKGDLDGTWYIPPGLVSRNYYNVPTTVIQKGTEYFEGCLNLVNKKQRCGTLNSEYISWSYYRASDNGFRGGGCTHALTGGTKKFIGVRGLLMMVDTPAGADDINTVYQGTVILNAEPGEGPKQPPEVPATTSLAKAAAATAAC